MTDSLWGPDLEDEVLVVLGSTLTRSSMALIAPTSSWQWSAFPTTVLIILVLIAAWYLRARWILGLRSRPWSKWKTISFLAGLFAVDVALQSPIVAGAMVHFQTHVIQHLLLMVVAPPLLALGAPSTLLLQTASRATKVRWLHIMQSRTFAAFSHPLSAFFFYFGVMTIFFLTPLINVSMQHMALMDVMNVIFLLGATLYWWPMIGLDPIVHWKMTYGARMMNILLGSAVEAFLGVTIIAASHPIASIYTVNDTHSGGALLWVSTEFITLGAFLPIYLQWARSDERAGRRADRELERRHEKNNLKLDSPVIGDIEERSLTPWELEWIARTGRAPQELRLGSEHLRTPVITEAQGGAFEAT